MERGPMEQKRYSQTVEDYFAFVAHLNVSMPTKELLKMLVTEKTTGVLTITQYNTHTETVDLTEMMSEDYKADRISDAFDILWQKAEQEGKSEELIVTFNEAQLH